MPSFEETVKSFLFVPATNGRGAGFVPILVVGWTLNYEFFFYLTVAATLFVSRPMLRFGLLIGLFTTLVALRPFIDPSDPIQFRMTSPLMFEFVAGICIAIVHPYVSTWRIKHALGFASLLCGALFVSIISPELYPDGPRFIYWGAPVTSLVFCVICFEGVLRKRVIGPLKMLGDASYSIYLSHTITAGIATFLLLSLSIVHPVLVFAVKVVIAVGLGILVFKFVEKPLLQAMRPPRTVAPRSESTPPGEDLRRADAG